MQFQRDHYAMVILIIHLFRCVCCYSNPSRWLFSFDIPNFSKQLEENLRNFGMTANVKCGNVSLHIEIGHRTGVENEFMSKWTISLWINYTNISLFHWTLLMLVEVFSKLHYFKSCIECECGWLVKQSI